MDPASLFQTATDLYDSGANQQQNYTDSIGLFQLASTIANEKEQTADPSSLFQVAGSISCDQNTGKQGEMGQTSISYSTARANLASEQGNSQKSSSQSLTLQDLAYNDHKHSSGQQAAPERAQMNEYYRTMERQLEAASVQAIQDSMVLSQAPLNEQLLQKLRLFSQLSQINDQMVKEQIHQGAPGALEITSGMECDIKQPTKADVVATRGLLVSLLDQIQDSGVFVHIEDKYQQLLSKIFSINIRSDYQRVTVQVPDISELVNSGGYSQLADVVSVQKAKQEAQKELFRQFKHDGRSFIMELRNYNEYVKSTPQNESQYLLRRNKLLGDALHKGIQSESQYINAYTQIYFSSIRSVAKTCKFEEEQHCVTYFYDDQYMFQDNCCKQINEMLLQTGQYVNFMRIYQLIIRFGVEGVEYNGVCCKIVILLNNYLNTIKEAQIHPTLLVYQVLSLIDIEYRQLRRPPLISQFYRLDLLPVQNTYDLQVLKAYTSNGNGVLLLTDGFYILKCQLNGEMSSQYKPNQVIVISIPRYHGFTKQSEYLFTLETLQQNYLSVDPPQICPDGTARLGFHKTRLLYQKDIVLNQLIIHHMFIVLYCQGGLLIVRSIHSPLTCYLIDRCGKHGFGQFQVGNVIHLIGFVIFQQFKSQVNLVTQFMCCCQTVSNSINAVFRAKRDAVQQLLQSCKDGFVTKQLRLQIIHLGNDNLVLIDQCDSVFVLKLFLAGQQITMLDILRGQMEDLKSVSSLCNKVVIVQNVFSEMMDVKGVRTHRLYYVQNVSSIEVRARGQWEVSAQQKEMLMTLNVVPQ